MTGGTGGGPRRDPARGLRAIGAAILCTHAITVGLAIPVVATGAGGGPAGIAALAAIAGLDLVATALLGRAPQVAILMGSALQAATVVAGVLSGFLLALGVIFGGLWVGWLMMRRSLTMSRPTPPGHTGR